MDYLKKSQNINKLSIFDNLKTHNKNPISLIKRSVDGKNLSRNVLNLIKPKEKKSFSGLFKSFVSLKEDNSQEIIFKTLKPVINNCPYQSNEFRRAFESKHRVSRNILCQKRDIEDENLKNSLSLNLRMSKNIKEHSVNKGVLKVRLLSPLKPIKNYYKGVIDRKNDFTFEIVNNMTKNCDNSRTSISKVIQTPSKSPIKSTKLSDLRVNSSKNIRIYTLSRISQLN